MSVFIDSPSGLPGVPFSIIQLSRRNYTGPVIYYLERADGHIKIGTTRNFRERYQTLTREFGPLTLLAWEPGHFDIERERHAQFSSGQVGGEWFVLGDDLRDHIVDLRFELRERGLA